MKGRSSSCNQEFQIDLARGRVVQPLRALAQASTQRGTTIRFKPDPKIFGTASFDLNSLARMLEPMAYLHAGFELWLVDERPNTPNRAIISHFRYPKGIADFLRPTSPLERAMQLLPVVFEGEAKGIKYSFGFRFSETPNTSLLSFANSSPTALGGTHVRGFLL